MQLKHHQSSTHNSFPSSKYSSTLSAKSDLTIPLPVKQTHKREHLNWHISLHWSGHRKSQQQLPHRRAVNCSHWTVKPKKKKNPTQTLIWLLPAAADWDSKSPGVEFQIQVKFLSLPQIPCGKTGKSPFPCSAWIPSPAKGVLFLLVCSNYKAALAGIIFSTPAQKPSWAGLWSQLGLLFGSVM